MSKELSAKGSSSAGHCTSVKFVFLSHFFLHLLSMPIEMSAPTISNVLRSIPCGRHRKSAPVPIDTYSTEILFRHSKRLISSVRICSSSLPNLSRPIHFSPKSYTYDIQSYIFMYLWLSPPTKSLFIYKKIPFSCCKPSAFILGISHVEISVAIMIICYIKSMRC